MTTPAGLPELPERIGTRCRSYTAETADNNSMWIEYTADQMLAYGDARALAAVPAGWKLVPVEPTTGMVCNTVGNITSTQARACYYAMLSAAPQPVTGEP